MSQVNEILLDHSGLHIPKNKIKKEHLVKLRRELTLEPVTFGNFQVKSFPAFEENFKEIIVPAYFPIDFLNLPGELPCNFIENKVEFKSNIILRPNQVECFEIVKKERDKEYGGGILTLTTASGKTVLGLKIIEYFKLRAIVIVNKVELIQQWEKEIKRFLPEATIGYIQGKKFDVDADITLATIQTITIKKEIVADMFLGYSCAIYDEIHNISSEVFSKIMFKVRPKFMFGLTATLERKDGLEKMIKWHVGEVLYSNITSVAKQVSEIHIYTYTGESSKEVYLKDGTAAVSSMITNIGDDNVRSDLIVNILKDLAKNKNRNILVISDRTKQLKYLNKKLGNEISGLFIGSLKREQLELSKEKQILLGTYGLASEGFNLPKLNCIVFATPRSSITQAIGRIYRKKHEITPIIVDIRDDFSMFKAQFYKRRKIYKTSIENPMFMYKNGNDSKNSKGKCDVDLNALSIDEINDEPCEALDEFNFL